MGCREGFGGNKRSCELFRDTSRGLLKRRERERERGGCRQRAGVGPLASSCRTEALLSPARPRLLERQDLVLPEDSGVGSGPQEKHRCSQIPAELFPGLRHPRPCHPASFSLSLAFYFRDRDEKLIPSRTGISPTEWGPVRCLLIG